MQSGFSGEILIAPCGMNCGACIAFMRDKNKCPGCRVFSKEHSNYVRKCKIKECEILKGSDSGFCYDCDVFPCRRMKQLDKRYSTKYRTSLIANLLTIKDKGVRYFLESESAKWTCPACGAELSIHRDFCPSCKHVLYQD